MCCRKLAATRNKVLRERDGQWRTLDGKAIYRQRAAAAAQGALVMENALTNLLGVQWVRRDDGHGREIKGVSGQIMDEFSKRTRQEIEGELGALIETYKIMHGGREPDARAGEPALARETLHVSHGTFNCELRAGAESDQSTPSYS